MGKNEKRYSDYIVYVDESGHASPVPDPDFPCFVLAFCLFEKKTYCETIAPFLQGLKFEFFGHDMVILHEREIRKAHGPFAILTNRRIREAFFTEINNMMEAAELSIIHETIIKKGDHLPSDNLYHLALQPCLERLYDKLTELGANDAELHVVFEERGKNEDRQLELEFRRLCDGKNHHGIAYPFVPVFASKKANSSGLQFADLVARPIGKAKLNPGQANRSHEILRKKDIRPELVQETLDL